MTKKPCTTMQLPESWDHDDGNVLWWRDGEPPWVGTPSDSDWPGDSYFAGWTRLPPPPDLTRPDGGVSLQNEEPVGRWTKMREGAWTAELRWGIHITLINVSDVDAWFVVIPRLIAGPVRGSAETALGAFGAKVDRLIADEIRDLGLPAELDIL